MNPLVWATFNQELGRIPESAEHPTVLLAFLNGIADWEVSVKNEIFKDIPDHEGVYQVSTIGNVKSFKHDKVNGKSLNPRLDTRGYPSVVLCKDGKLVNKTVHKLIQSAFGLGEGHVDHVNGIRDDNRVENLRVGTQRQNLQNLECHRKGQLVGASYRKNRSHLSTPWVSNIQINDKTKYLGFFATELEAHESYMKAVALNDK